MELDCDMVDQAKQLFLVIDLANVPDFKDNQY